MSDTPEPSAPKRSPFIATAPARAALVPLEQGLGARAPFVLLTGDPGTGRSMLAREALRRRGDRVVPVLFPDPAPPPTELLATLLVLFGGGPPKPGAMAFALTERLMDTLANVTAAGRVAVALIDDAERLTDEHLLELHRITDLAAKRQCPFELLLVGTPKLPDRFDAPHMATVRPRISVRATLGRFSPNDTREYLQSRLNAAGVPCTGMFSRKASRDIHQITVGTVRLIEVLAAESLRRATRAGQGTVSPEHVRAADHALRTGRPSEAASTPTPSQVRAADVGMAANTRSVGVAHEPTHAPSQGMQPMGDQARHVASHERTPSAHDTPPQVPQAAQQNQQHKQTKPFRPGKGGANIAHAQRDANTNNPAASHPSPGATSGSPAHAQPTANASSASRANPGATSGTPPHAQPNANASTTPQANPRTTSGTPAPAHGNANTSSTSPARDSAASGTPASAQGHAPNPAASHTHANPTTPSGTHARPTAKPVRDPGSIGDYPSSDDPRVQEWLARFGGKGVRVGGSYPTASSPQDYADFGSNRMADADGVVTPARPIRRNPEPSVTQDSAGDAQATSTPSASSQPPVAAPHATPASFAAGPQPTAATSPAAPSAPSQPAVTAASMPTAQAPSANAQHTLPSQPASMPAASTPASQASHASAQHATSPQPAPTSASGMNKPSTQASHASAQHATSPQPAPTSASGTSKPADSGQPGKHGKQKHKHKRGHVPASSAPAASTHTPAPSSPMANAPAPAPAATAPEPVAATPSVARIERHVPGRRSAAAPKANRPAGSRANQGSMLLVASVILAAVAAIGVSQRHAIQSMFSQAFTETASHKAVTTVATPAPAPEPPPAPPAQYGIAVGSYPTRDMANAECEYLSRLVPVRVRVNGLGDGRGYRLLLGRFDDRASAELASKRMQDQGLIPDARVIELAPLPASVSPVDTLAGAQPESTSRETTVRETSVRDTPRSVKHPRRRSR